MDEKVTWEEFRVNGHEIIDDIVSSYKSLREKSLWQEMPIEIREKHLESSSLTMTHNGQSLASIYDEFKEFIQPYGSGNIHPGFMGWVQGGGNSAALIGDILTSSMNMNCGGRDHVGIALEKQVIHWVKDWFSFPSNANGIFVTGSSMANFMSLITARQWKDDSTRILKDSPESSLSQYVAYTSMAAHRCISQAVYMSGIDRVPGGGLRKIPIDSLQRMNTEKLLEAIENDIQAGLVPLFVAATAGTVDVGAIDNLVEISKICKKYNIWMHVDGAYGALGVLSHRVKPMLQGIELADSIAFDFHKWGQVQYDAGMILVREGDLLRNSFSSPASYLSRENGGMFGGDYWPCDYGPDLSRGCRALKTWFTIKAYGLGTIGDIITRSCELAKELETLVLSEPDLELLMPVNLNIVCFRYRGLDSVNRQIVIDLHREGRVAPSLTTISGVVAIRAALFNHRTNRQDVEALIQSVIRIGRNLEGST